mgnify:CR=1 FL=1
MPFESTADRLALVTEFGVDCNMARGTADWDIKGIFDRDFVQVNGVETYKPILTVRFEDVFEPGQLTNDTYRATSVNITDGAGYVGGGFDIVAYQHDGMGMVQLILERQS